MQGFVSQEIVPCLPVVVCGWEARTNVVASIDTGFSGYLTLPPLVVQALSLPQSGFSKIILGDGSVVECPVHDAGLEWDGVVIKVSALAIECEVLLGMSTLHCHDVFFEAVEGGLVTITRRA